MYVILVLKSRTGGKEEVWHWADCNRDLIAFPKTKKAKEPTPDARSPAGPEKLKELKSNWIYLNTLPNHAVLLLKN